MKPRLLFIINRFVIGGQASDTIPLLYHLHDKYEIKVLSGKKEADEIEPLFLLDRYPGLSISKVDWLKRSVNPLNDVAALFKVYRFIKKYNPHIVHTHGAKSGLIGRLAAYLSRVPVIIHTFHGHLFHSYFNKFFTRGVLFTERSLARITDAAIALSPSQKVEITKQFRVFPEQKVQVVPLGIDVLPMQNASVVPFRKQYQLLEDDVAIAIVSRIVPIKNHLDFLKIAHKILTQGNKRCFFFIIGDGNIKEELLGYLKENQIKFSTPSVRDEQAKVIFTSWLSDMDEVFNGLDIIALTSLNEGTPVSLIEAQLCGKPVVAYDVGGVKDTFVDSVSGYLVDKGDIAAFACRLLKLIDNKQLRAQMGEEGKQYCSRKFSKQSEVNAIDKLYRGLLAEKGIKV